MTARLWKDSKDGKFQVVSLTKETLEGGQEVMRKAFFIDECVSIAVELYKYPEAIKELEELTLRAARDGVSLVVIEKDTGKIAGAAFNLIQVPEKPGEVSYFEAYEAKCKEPSSKCLVRFMIDSDAEYDLFENCKVDSLLEIMFCAIMPEFRGHGLASLLFEATIEMGRKLLAGENIRLSVTGVELQPKPAPTIVAAFCTSFITQKIARALKFEKAVEMDYKQWSFDGKTFAERIGPHTSAITLNYFRL